MPRRTVRPTGEADPTVIVKAGRRNRRLVPARTVDAGARRRGDARRVSAKQRLAKSLSNGAMRVRRAMTLASLRTSRSSSTSGRLMPRLNHSPRAGRRRKWHDREPGASGRACRTAHRLRHSVDTWPTAARRAPPPNRKLATFLARVPPQTMWCGCRRQTADANSIALDRWRLVRQSRMRRARCRRGDVTPATPRCDAPVPACWCTAALGILVWPLNRVRSRSLFTRSSPQP